MTIESDEDEDEMEGENCKTGRENVSKEENSISAITSTDEIDITKSFIYIETSQCIQDRRLFAIPESED